jgi:hypothetical protein
LVTAVDSGRFRAALAAFDGANSRDPQTEVDRDGDLVPRALLYARRMSRVIDQFCPNASESLQLAARSQHLRRWELPRDDFSAGRQGYLDWREHCAAVHRETAAAILAECGYPDSEIVRVGELLQKEDRQGDPEVQCLEDVACLVFIEFYLKDFGRRFEDSKLDRILRRTWGKMSVEGRRAAAALEIAPQVSSWLVRAGLNL